MGNCVLMQLTRPKRGNEGGSLVGTLVGELCDDRNRLTSAYTSGGSIWDPRGDLDDDGDVDDDDLDLYDTKDDLWAPGPPYPVVAQAFSDVGNPYMFQGVPHFALDTAADGTSPTLPLNQHRYRFNDPVTGRWTTRDPGGYVDGLNLYEYLSSNPRVWADTLGHCIDSPRAAVIAGVLTPAELAEIFTWGVSVAAVATTAGFVEEPLRELIGDVVYTLSNEDRIRLRAYPKTPRVADIGSEARRRPRARRSKDGQKTSCRRVANPRRALGTDRTAVAQGPAQQEGRAPASAFPEGDGRHFLCVADGLSVEGGACGVRLGQHPASTLPSMGWPGCVPEALASGAPGVR